MIRALSSASIKGVPRDISGVCEDRLKFVLRLVNSFVRTTPGSVRLQTGSTHEVDWKSLGNSAEYKRHIKLFAEVERADLGDLSEDAKLACMLNIWHIMVIHGFVVKQQHLCRCVWFFKSVLFVRMCSWRDEGVLFCVIHGERVEIYMLFERSWPFVMLAGQDPV